VTANALLEVRGLEVSYGPIHAVRGVSLSVGLGDAVALLGPNGAGKSSTLRAISRLESFGGDVHFDGIDVRRQTPERLARAGMLHVPEGRHIFPTLTVHENLMVAMAARGRRPAEVTPDHIYDLFPMLAPLRRRGGWALSGGEQQMLAIGRALVGAPRLLLLDEPSLGLAPSLVKAVFTALRNLRDRVPLLLVEQNTTAALGLCTQALVLVDGKVALSGSPEELRGSEELVESYLGQRDTGI
jgi:branched-chain amino acid transport system ATP-binding protein